MEKLELKHVVGYLPYGLPARLSKEGIFNLDSEFPNEHKDKIGYINNFNWYNGEFAGELKISKTYSFDFDSEDEIEILLRPLSELTKEIEVNGAKFVPIERLLDIETKHNWSNSDYLESESGQNEWWVKLKVEKPSYIFGYNSTMGFYCLNQFSEKQFIRNQIELYEKLYEWHFDLHSLIEKGLAIDLNTIENGIQ